MPRLLFEPVTNKIGDDNYIIVPKSGTDVYCAIRCNEAAAFIINAMYPEHISKADIAEKYCEKYPDITPEQALEEVVAVVSILRGFNAGTEGNTV